MAKILNCSTQIEGSVKSSVSLLVLFLFLSSLACSPQASQNDIREAAIALLTEEALPQDVQRTSTPLPSETFTPEPTPTPNQFSIDELRSISLQLTDLQSGYVLAQEFTLEVNALRAAGANRTADYLDTVQPTIGLDMVYTRGTLFDLANIYSRVFVFPSESIAADYLEIHPTLFGEQGLEFQPVSYTRAADETKAFLTQASSGDFTLDTYFVVMRRANVVAAINYGTLTGFADLAELDQYVRILEERLIQAIP